MVAYTFATSRHARCLRAWCAHLHSLRNAILKCFIVPVLACLNYRIEDLFCCARAKAVYVCVRARVCYLTCSRHVRRECCVAVTISRAPKKAASKSSAAHHPFSKATMNSNRNKDSDRYAQPLTSYPVAHARNVLQQKVNISKASRGVLDSDVWRDSVASHTKITGVASSRKPGLTPTHSPFCRITAGSKVDVEWSAEKRRSAELRASVSPLPTDATSPSPTHATATGSNRLRPLSAGEDFHPVDQHHTRSETNFPGATPTLIGSDKNSRNTLSVSPSPINPHAKSNPLRPRSGGRGASGAAIGGKFGVGSKVMIQRSGGSVMGTVTFCGMTHLGAGQYVGVELLFASNVQEDPDAPLHSGTVDDREYFVCKHGRGLLVPASKATWNGFRVSTLLSTKSTQK